MFLFHYVKLSAFNIPVFNFEVGNNCSELFTVSLSRKIVCDNLILQFRNKIRNKKQEKNN